MWIIAPLGSPAAELRARGVDPREQTAFLEDEEAEDPDVCQVCAQMLLYSLFYLSFYIIPNSDNLVQLKNCSEQEYKHHNNNINSIFKYLIWREKSNWYYH